MQTPKNAMEVYEQLLATAKTQLETMPQGRKLLEIAPKEVKTLIDCICRNQAQIFFAMFEQ